MGNCPEIPHRSGRVPVSKTPFYSGRYKKKFSVSPFFKKRFLGQLPPLNFPYGWVRAAHLFFCFLWGSPVLNGLFVCFFLGSAPTLLSRVTPGIAPDSFLFLLASFWGHPAFIGRRFCCYPPVPGWFFLPVLL